MFHFGKVAQIQKAYLNFKKIRTTQKLFFEKQLLLKTFFPSTPVVAAYDESIHILNTDNTNLFKVNNRNTRRYKICSINKDTEMMSYDVVILSLLVIFNRF